MLKENLDNIVKMNNEVYVLGRLATGRDYYPRMVERERTAVSKMNNSNSVVFFIEALSEEPDFSKNILNKDKISDELRDLYIGIDSHQLYSKTSAAPFGDTYSKQKPYNYNTPMEKEELICDSLENKLLIFKVNIQEVTIENTGRKNIILESVLNIDDDGESYYETIPEVQMGVDIFENKLILGNTLHLKGYTHELPLPEAIICGNYIYVFRINDWEKVDGTIDGWRFNNKSGDIRKLYLDIKENEYDTKVIRKLDSIVFVESNYLYNNLCNECLESIHIDMGSKNTTKQDEGEEINTEDAEKINNSSRQLNKNNISEIIFLNKLKNYTMSKNLCYDMKDIVNLHVSIKTNHITIVAGMSGTGKTQISLAYADVLGLSKDEETLLFLPITPSYTEPEDITGYLNTTTGLFVSSETGLVDLLMHAQKYPDKLHFVLFDEMNLSQVEHWFAPFISLLELDKKDRNLKLYSKNSVCHNRIQYSDTINIGDNIRFIGTVNLDETTKDFSDRLLDRANLVSLKKGTLKDFKREKRDFVKDELEIGEFKLSNYIN